ncbi:putative glycosyl hydrolase family 7 protein [Diplodia seriata]|uniref:Glucanase n=1 Tax=Diplodia seriata TaxID=420778 RepID=A0A0G2EEU2_9PEZI|nr:putative glycosyl hydrolase family 7 protein [Diplodia seriata]
MLTQAVLATLAGLAASQQVGTQKEEVHPSLTWQTCTSGGSCTTNQGEVVVDANWRWVHNTEGYTNCYTGNTWNEEYCTDNEACAAACALDGADYQGTYGATTSGDELKLNFITTSTQTNVGSRLYLMESEDTYAVHKLLNKEFTFDVDVSNLPCGLNGAVYFVSMDADGGMAKFPDNKAGAKYGTGYCDSQCPRDLKFIEGQANVDGWTPSENDENSGVGNLGSCCAEMDIWEANSISSAYTPHSCSNVAAHSCNGDDCGGTYSETRYAGDCDPDGCDFNSYRQGVTDFYGPGMTVDTNSPITVVTQFITDDGTASGTLSEIKRFYVQGGSVIPNSESTIAGVSGNSITAEYCDAQKSVFGDNTSFQDKGGMASMSQALNAGMVLVMSVWDDHHSNMLWLDSSYPLDADVSKPGVARGTCSTDSGKPEDVEVENADASVVYSNIKVGDLNSTFTAA